jgi:hypothetical protein
MGRPPAERKAIARCFVAKAFLRYPHTRSLIHELKARTTFLKNRSRIAKEWHRNIHKPKALRNLCLLSY